MLADLKKFQLDLTHFAQVVVPENHAKLCGRIAFRLHQYVVAGSPGAPGTPVDTGWARANWGVFIGRKCPTEPMGVRGQYNKLFDAASMTISVPRYPFIWVYNNVPYIEVLEDGHSKQAPTGMMSGALNALQTYVDTKL
jgi:hypothetical protein